MQYQKIILYRYTSTDLKSDIEENDKNTIYIMKKWYFLWSFSNMLKEQKYLKKTALKSNSFQ